MKILRKIKNILFDIYFRLLIIKNICLGKPVLYKFEIVTNSKIIFKGDLEMKVYGNKFSKEKISKKEKGIFIFKTEK